MSYAIIFPGVSKKENILYIELQFLLLFLYSSRWDIDESRNILYISHSLINYQRQRMRMKTYLSMLRFWRLLLGRRWHCLTGLIWLRCESHTACHILYYLITKKEEHWLLSVFVRKFFQYYKYESFSWSSGKLNIEILWCDIHHFQF